jgi:glycosyltransferase involved in cell wall biosynthesis
MSQAPAISLILPAFNERASIGKTIQEAQAYFTSRLLSHEILVAADGDDGTREFVAELAATDPALRVLGSAERRGKGFGIRQAVGMARGQIIGFADADNKTPIEEFDHFRPLLESGYDLVIGSRGLPQSQIERPQKLYRRLGSWGFRMVLKSILSLPGIKDTQCGFKFFRREVALDLFHRQRIDGYMFDVEILHLARRAGYRIGQVPVRWRDDGDSRLVLFRGNVRNILDVLKIRFGSYPPKSDEPIATETAAEAGGAWSLPAEELTRAA